MKCYVELLSKFIDKLPYSIKLKQLMEHTIIMCSLMKGPTLTKTGDDFEYEITGETYRTEVWVRL